VSCLYLHNPANLILNMDGFQVLKIYVQEISIIDSGREMDKIGKVVSYQNLKNEVKFFANSSCT
jgi:hypothetical protein